MTTTIGEFELIERYFTRPPRRIAVGVGDDCAVLAPRPGHELCISSDLLVEGRHFLSTVARMDWGDQPATWGVRMTLSKPSNASGGRGSLS